MTTVLVIGLNFVRFLFFYYDFFSCFALSSSSLRVCSSNSILFFSICSKSGIASALMRTLKIITEPMTIALPFVVRITCVRALSPRWVYTFLPFNSSHNLVISNQSFISFSCLFCQKDLESCRILYLFVLFPEN